jgi:ABC-type transport system involved in cytochrome c biogenesis permease subunit
MSSQLVAIVDAIAAMSVTGVTTVYSGTTLKNAVEIADVPARIVSAVGMQSARTKTSTLGGSGHVMMTEWTITDVALLRPAGMGIGLKDVVDTMESYMAAYHDAVRTLVAPAWQLIDVRVRAQILEWPQASGRSYDTVVATLVISEIVQ